MSSNHQVQVQKKVSPVGGYLGSQLKDCEWIEEGFRNLGVRSIHDGSAGGLALPYYLAQRNWTVYVSDISYLSYTTAKAVFDSVTQTSNRLGTQLDGGFDGYLTNNLLGSLPFDREVACNIDYIASTAIRESDWITLAALGQTLLRLSYRSYNWDKGMIRSLTKTQLLSKVTHHIDRLRKIQLPGKANVVGNMPWTESPRYSDAEVFFTNPDLPFADGKQFYHSRLYENIDSILQQQEYGHPRPLGKGDAQGELQAIYDAVKGSGKHRYVAWLIEDNAYPTPEEVLLWLTNIGADVSVIPSPGRKYLLNQKHADHKVYIVVAKI